MSFILFIIVSLICNIILLILSCAVLFIILSKFFSKISHLIITSYSLALPTLILCTYYIELWLINTYSLQYIILSISISFIVFFLLLKESLFHKLPGPTYKKLTPPGTKYVKLKTGSRLSYWQFESSGGKTPIIYVHGGPGAHTRNIDRIFFSRFIELGHDVYLYDQPGGGFSDYLSIEEYTMNRFIEDLNAFRIHFGLHKVILVGQSFGARICSYYLSQYEEHVESVIFAGPGGLKPSTIKSDIKNKKVLDRSKIEFAVSPETKFNPKIREIIRFATSIIMCKVGGEKVVSSFITQKEITEYATRMIPDAIGRAYHKKYIDKVPTITSGGLNVFVNVVLHNDYDKIYKEMINTLKNIGTPVLILRGAYDYVPWEDTRYYCEVFKNNYLTYIEESGHIAWSVNENDTYATIKYFISGEVDQIKTYNKTTNPLYER